MKLLQSSHRSHPPTILPCIRGATCRSCSTNILWRRGLGRATFCLPLCFGLRFKDILFRSSLCLRLTLSLPNWLLSLAITFGTSFGFLLSFQSAFLLPWWSNKMIGWCWLPSVRTLRTNLKAYSSYTYKFTVYILYHWLIWFPKCCSIRYALDCIIPTSACSWRNNACRA